MSKLICWLNVEVVLMLVDLCRDASCHEVFLLSCVALANMSLLESATCDHLSLNSTVSVLINASYQHIAHSVFAKDQARFIVTSNLLICDWLNVVDFLCPHHAVTEPCFRPRSFVQTDIVTTIASEHISMKLTGNNRWPLLITWLDFGGQRLRSH